MSKMAVCATDGSKHSAKWEETEEFMALQQYTDAELNTLFSQYCNSAVESIPLENKATGSIHFLSRGDIGILFKTVIYLVQDLTSIAGVELSRRNIFKARICTPIYGSDTQSLTTSISAIVRNIIIACRFRWNISFFSYFLKTPAIDIFGQLFFHIFTILFYYYRNYWCIIYQTSPLKNSWKYNEIY